MTESKKSIPESEREDDPGLAAALKTVVFVRAARAICGYDYDTAVVVLPKTGGRILARGSGVGPKNNGFRLQPKSDASDYAVDVVWDVVVLNADGGNPVLSTDWEWLNVPVDALEYAGMEGGTDA
jgi:hypothetical protein